jgi:hypothetical protein
MVYNIGDRIKQRVSSRTFKLRNRPGEALQERMPSASKRNIGEGTLAGAITAGIAVVAEDTLGVPFGASADTYEVERLTQNGDEWILYTVDVNAPSQNMAQARAFIDSSTGFLSYIVDEFDVEEADVVTVRPLRDTYRVKVKVKATEVSQ